MLQLCTTHMDLHPLTHVQLNNPHNKCLGYVVFEWHAKFQINWESFAHRDQQKNMIAPKPWRWRMPSFGLWTGFNVNLFRTHSHN